MRKGRGFTYIELMVVMGVLALLAAIAIPNFMEAQTRADVSRSVADLTALSHALESYRIDEEMYPLNQKGLIPDDALVGLTTPISYIMTLPRFPDYAAKKEYRLPPVYINLGQVFPPENPYMRPHAGGMAVYSISWDGPDGERSLKVEDDEPEYIIYDPTNGTRSGGDVVLFGP